jgi:pyruvate,orthophosphate dikinase
VRKQCHVECNPLLIEFIEAVGHFWATGDGTRLHRFTPSTLHASFDIESEEYRGLHAVFGELVGSDDVRGLFALDPTEFERRLAGVAVGRAVDREKARLLFQLRRLIARKYELDHGDLLDRLAEFHPLASDRLETLREALQAERHEAALEVLLDVLEQLKEIILSGERTEAVEDIYYKRHIAAGIPSMYGRYREQKLDALGLSFRIESMAGALFERMIAERSQGYVTRSTLSVVVRWMRLLIRALRIDGCKARGPATAIAMLEQALATDGISVDQYINILQFLSQSVENLIRIRFLEPYDPVMRRILRRMLDRGMLPAAKAESAEATILKISEAFLRDLIAQGFGLQQLDNLVGNTLRALLDNREKLDPPTMNLLMSYDARRTTVEIDDRESPYDGAIHLGNKGFQLKRMAQDGLPVPNGFALTTEVFRCHPAIVACEELGREYERDIRREVERLERKVDCRFGDPERPLLLSVRSSGAISMPGVLDTFLDVGISEEIAEGLAARSGSPWGAWDAYRRFHQCWGMAHGIDRDPFDALMRDVKRGAGVAKKAHLPSAQMRELALRYRDLLVRRDVEVPEDPYEQLFACIDLSLRSWYADRAQAYRSACQIADEWGTAVIVQSMVYGNLHERSGTGVVLTCDPRVSSASVHLYGDFIVQGQGEDVVSGLVETFPISEAQRGAESRGAKISLEKDFPRIYQAMERHARTLIDEHGMFHQEIEFTFESDDPSDLFVLQTRDIVLSQVSDVPAFDPGEALEHARLAMGIGAGGGALSGRVAHTSDDIEQLRQRFGDEPIILLRPDTVPDDIPLILRADGMVTALGGATSHAAVAAQRLGRTCIVGCRQLEVDEPHARSQLAGEVLETGDFISIDGRDGSIYKGRHRSTVLRRQSLALDAVGAGT